LDEPGAQEERAMKAVWYEENGAARDVLVVGEMETPKPAAGEVLVRLAASGVNLPTSRKIDARIANKIAGLFRSVLQ